MPAPRPFALIGTADQWRRASHEETALIGGVVQLHWHADDNLVATPGDASIAHGAGLAFDSHCRLFHGVPDEGRVERLLWAAADPFKPARSTNPPRDLFAPGLPTGLGDFTSEAPRAAALLDPRGMGFDDEGCLLVAEHGKRRIVFVDPEAQRLVGTTSTTAAPVDIACDPSNAFVLCDDPPALIRLRGRFNPELLPWPAAITRPSRLALSPEGTLFILENAGTAGARVWKWGPDSATPVEFPDGTPASTTTVVPFASDLEFQFPGDVPEYRGSAAGVVLVVARRPGDSFLRFIPGPEGIAAIPPLLARHYDGRGIVRTPDGRIGFWTLARPEAPGGTFRHAVAARLRFEDIGAVTTFRLDSGEFRTPWGRVFLDACIPGETSIRVRCIATDDPPGDGAIVHSPPSNDPGTPPHPELSPPLPPQSLAAALEAVPAQSLHRRETGMEWPWIQRPDNDDFGTYEAPIIADPGRYLWVRIELSGNTRVTPRLRAVRVEHPAHDYLRRIPGIYSRGTGSTAFLQRFLALFEGTLGDLEARADARRALLDPRSAPPEALPWLAGFVGLVLDERLAHAPRPGGITADVRPTLIEEAAQLFRFRGTLASIRRFLEIYLGVTPILLEKFRLRGMGGAILGEDGATASTSVLGAGFRVGGAIGEDTAMFAGGSAADAFATHAHRFSVILPTSLSEEAASVVDNILEVHRPAHTVVDVCTVGAGMRVGRGLHVGLTSRVGRTGGFQKLRTGSSFLGRGTVVGRPAPGVRPGASRLGEDFRPG